MSFDSPELRRYAYYTPPRAYVAPAATTTLGTPAGYPGQMIVLGTSATALAIQLSAAQMGMTYSAEHVVTDNAIGAPNGMPSGLTGVDVTILADGQDLGVIFGPTLASISGPNAPLLTAVGALTNGVYANAIQTCHRIPSGQERRYNTQQGIDLWVGIVAATSTGFVRIFQSSPNGING